MTIEAKVVLDSVAPNGARLTTFELTYPRFIHAELMTHRVFSRNAASSRAIPTPKKIERIRQDCAMPSEWGVNQKGMQAGKALDAESACFAAQVWRSGMKHSLNTAELLCGLRCVQCVSLFRPDGTCQCEPMGMLPLKLDLHKQVANRVLEPYDHITVVVSTTKLNNHWELRLEVDPETGRPMADPTYFELATKWKAAFDASKPQMLHVGEWHLPYVDVEEDTRAIVDRYGSTTPAEVLSLLKKTSVGRVARTSYMRQGEGDVKANVELHDRLSSNGHWSPFEAVATPIEGILLGGNLPRQKCAYCNSTFEGRGANIRGVNVCFKCGMGHVTSGNFVGWHQYRKDFANEGGGD